MDFHELVKQVKHRTVEYETDKTDCNKFFELLIYDIPFIYKTIFFILEMHQNVVHFTNTLPSFFAKQYVFAKQRQKGKSPQESYPSVVKYE